MKEDSQEQPEIELPNTQNFLNLKIVLLFASRTLHIFSSMLALTIIILECFFDLLTVASVQENPSFMQIKRTNTIAMIASGVAMCSFMRRDDNSRHQQQWQQYFPVKFLISLLLTPSCEKMFRLAVGDARMDISVEWQKTFKMFQLGLVLMLYLYSLRIRSFREQSNNFEDSS